MELIKNLDVLPAPCEAALMMLLHMVLSVISYCSLTDPQTLYTLRNISDQMADALCAVSRWLENSEFGGAARLLR